MSVDIEILRGIVHELYVPLASQRFGQPGADSLQSLLHGLHRLYRYVEPSCCKSRLSVFVSVDGTVPPIEGTAVDILSWELLAQLVTGPTAIQVLQDGQARFWANALPDPIALSSHAVVYTYEGGAESIYAGGDSRPVPKLFPGADSVFAIPAFTDLLAAMEHYKAKMARLCSCKILEGIWHDGNRIFLRNGPEWTMRDSLTQFLKSCLRGDTEVRPEQIVDETHPVDIKVTWDLGNRLALIEIKWLGTPRYDDGHLGTTYTDARAREGARQLADYLDANRVQAPLKITRGYLVIFDGRRPGLTPATAALSRAEGLRYANEEISFEPKYHEARDDFAPPIRMFMEPACG